MPTDSLTSRLFVFIAVFVLMGSVAAIHAAPPAFPGAEGFGAIATGGRGREVVYVTNLNDSGPGSFREAVSRGKRNVLFKVSGTIQLKDSIHIREGDLTIAGQTAPGDGICIAGEDVVIHGNNVIVRYMRFRPGDELGREHDALTVWAANRVIIDHCSLSWSTDSVSDVVKGSYNVTIQWCIVSEPLRKSVHVKGSHGYGTGWGHGSYHHNLIAHCDSRSPRLAAEVSRGLADVRNNVIYNWGFGWAYGGENADINLVGNYYRPGPNSEHSHILFNPWSKSCRLHLAGNVMDGNAEVTADNRLGVVSTGSVWNETVAAEDVLLDRPFTIADRDAAKGMSVTTHAAEEAYELVLSHAGAVLPRRDAVDQRVIQSVRDRTGRIIDSQKDVGGWPELKSAAAPEDSDGDGLPDSWEAEHGLNSADPADGQAIGDAGYSHLEDYLNTLATPRGRSAAGASRDQESGGQKSGIVEVRTVTPDS